MSSITPSSRTDSHRSRSPRTGSRRSRVGGTQPSSRQPSPRGRRGDLWAVVDEHRIAAMARAVELGVDRDEFAFTSEIERAAWLELEVEFEALVEREGSCWSAER